MALKRRGNSYAELAIVCVLMAAVTTQYTQSDNLAINRGRDARLRANLEALRSAMGSYLLKHGGRPPRDARELAPHLVSPLGTDPLAWHGSGGSGRVAVEAGSLVLRDEAGGRPAGVDAFGRAYADYR